MNINEAIQTIKNSGKTIKELMELESNQPVMEINKFGTKRWYLNGKLHRTDGPAIEWSNGSKSWYLDGKFLFEIYPDGTFYSTSA